MSRQNEFEPPNNGRAWFEGALTKYLQGQSIMRDAQAQVRELQAGILKGLVRTDNPYLDFEILNFGINASGKRAEFWSQIASAAKDKTGENVALIKGEGKIVELGEIQTGDLKREHFFPFGLSLSFDTPIHVSQLLSYYVRMNPVQVVKGGITLTNLDRLTFQERSEIINLSSREIDRKGIVLVGNQQVEEWFQKRGETSHLRHLQRQLRIEMKNLE